MELIEFEELGSTNGYCGELDLRNVEEFTTVWAHRQTAGRGQRGNRWESEGEKNLTFSVVLHPSFLPAARQYELTKALSLGVSDWVAEELGGEGNRVQIKWPNDIYVDGRKICGMLIENKIGERYETAVCGIGVNVNQTEFGEGAPNATSLKLLTGKEYELRGLLEGLLESLRRRYEELVGRGQWAVVGGQQSAGSIEREYLGRLMNLGKECNYIYKGKPIRATITGVSEWGHLQLTTNDGEKIECGMKEIVFECVSR